MVTALDPGRIVTILTKNTYVSVVRTVTSVSPGTAWATS
jgi:hypothetical protein